MEKKGTLVEETGKFLMMVAVIAFLLILLYLFRDKLYSVFEKIKELVLYGQ